MPPPNNSDISQAKDITKTTVNQARQQILRNYFLSRLDIFATEDRQAQRKWICVQSPVPDYLMENHVKGKTTVGTYPNQLGNVPSLVFDIDSKTEEAKALARWLRDWLTEKGIVALIEDTGGRGLHVWALFLCFVPAHKARALGNLALAEYQTNVGPLPRPIEVFPKPTKGRKDVGFAIRLPWGKHRSGNFSHFVNASFEPDDDMAIALIQSGHRITEVDLDKLIPAETVKEAKRRPMVAPEQRWGAVITEGSRHNTLFSLARELRARRFLPDRILVELKMHNAQRCAPPLEEDEVESIWQSATEQVSKTPRIRGEDEARQAMADRLVEIADREALLFHNQFNEPYAQITVNEHKEIWPCGSKRFRWWLAGRLWICERKAPSAEGVNAALNVIKSQACFDGESFNLENRVAWHDDAIWYDLTDSDWRAVRITSHGWETVPQPPVLFRRYAHQQPQVEPVRGGDIWQLTSFLNIPDRRSQLLAIVYIVTDLVPDIPHPVSMPYGDHGAGKSMLQRLCRRLLDPSAQDLLSVPRDPTEMVQQLSHNYLAFYDNLSHLPDWVSDLLSRAVTGQGFSKRELYSDEDDVIFSFRRCVGINGINIVVQKPDLLDRAILFQLKAISQEDRRREKELLSEFDEARSFLFGAILDTLSTAMAIQPRVHLEYLPRMADFCEWGYAVAEAMGVPGRDFLDAYLSNISAQTQEAVTASLVGTALLSFMEAKDEWVGSASELLRKLDNVAEGLEIKKTARDWPKAPHILTRRLNELKANLEQIGIAYNSRHTESGTLVMLENKRQKRHSVSQIRRETASPDVTDATDAFLPTLQPAPDSDYLDANFFLPDGTFVCPRKWLKKWHDADRPPIVIALGQTIGDLERFFQALASSRAIDDIDMGRLYAVRNFLWPDSDWPVEDQGEITLADEVDDLFNRETKNGIS